MSAAAGALPDSLTIEDPAQRAALPPGVEVFRFSGPMFFGVAREMLDALNRVGRKPAIVILRMDQVPYIDSTGVRVLETFVRRAAVTGTRIIFSELRPQPGEFLARIHSQLTGIAIATSFDGALALAIQ
jgi:SulP family sulfate permease